MDPFTIMMISMAVIALVPLVIQLIPVFTQLIAPPTTVDPSATTPAAVTCYGIQWFNGADCEDCPGGMVPNTARDTCEECDPETEIVDATGACFECDEGMAPNDALDTCEEVEAASMLNGKEEISQDIDFDHYTNTTHTTEAKSSPLGSQIYCALLTLLA
jgi:hypothetical protein